MKNLFYLFLAVTIFACSSDDSGNEYNNNNPSDLVGTWEGDTYDADDAPNGDPVSSLWVQLAETSGGSWNETSYITSISQVYGVNWTATDTVMTIRLYDDGDPVDTKIVSYEIDKSGESWVANITDEEGDMFSLTKID
jgi:hypothetical protein